MEIEEDKEIKRKKIEETTLIEISDTESKWSVNYDQFIRTFRNEAIIDYVGKKVSLMGASILRAMFALTSMYERTKNDQQSGLIFFFDFN